MGVNWLIIMLAGLVGECLTASNTILLGDGEDDSISVTFMPHKRQPPAVYVIKAKSPGLSIILDCSVVDLGDGMADECVANMKLTDTKGNVERICDSQERVWRRSDGGSLTIEVTPDPEFRVLAKCDVEARQSNKVGPPPKFDNIYFSTGSREVDSSEHGGVPGKKKTTCQCGKANKNLKRIVGGKETEVNEFTFLGAVVDSDGEQFCGCSILTKRHTLTAAHCTNDFRAQELAVVVGTHIVDSPKKDPGKRQMIPVKKIHQHTDYVNNGKIIINDISILELMKDITFNGQVGPVCLTSLRQNLDGQYVTIMGWGRVGHNREASPVPKKASSRLVNLDICSRKNYFADAKAKTQICTFGTGKSTCMGDSGGPVAWVDPETNMYTQLGLVSAGLLCGQYKPIVHTDVAAFYPWIQNIIQGGGYGLCTKA